MWTENQTFDVHLLAFDIVSFSRNLDNADGLFLDRKALMDAIRGTQLFPKMVHEKGVFLQFLGDEFRVAFRSSLAQLSEAATFAEEVFHQLQDLADKAPTIRGVLLTGAVKSKDFRGYQYLEGDLIYAAARWQASGLKEGELLSESAIHGWAPFSQGGISGFKRRFDTREIKNVPPIRITDHSNSHPFFIFACALHNCEPSTTATNTLRTVVDDAISQSQRGDDIKKIKCSISPNGIIVAFNDDEFTGARAFLESLLPHATRTPGFSAALSTGKLRVIKKEDWLSENFEGAAAIVTCRILAQLKSGQFAYAEQIKAHRDFKAGTLEPFPGKRDEVFRAYLVKDYFVSALPTSSPCPAPLPPPVPPGIQEPASFLGAAAATLDANNLPIPATKGALAAAGGLSPDKVGAFGAMTLAMRFSGLEADVADNPPSSGAAAPQSDPFARFALHAMSSVIGTEIALWKEFHSVLGPLSRYCETACPILSSSSSQPTDNRIEEIADRFKTITQDGLNDYSRLCIELRDEGFDKLLTSLQSASGSLGMTEVSAGCGNLITLQSDDPLRYFEVVRDTAKSMNAIRDKCLIALSPEPAHAGLLKKLVLSRTRSAQLAIEFSSALFILEKYLSGFFDGRERENTSLRLVRDTVFKKIAEQLKPQNCNLVVTSSNSVIFDWINLLALIRPKQ